MIIVIRDGEIILAYTKSCRVLGLGGRLLFVLFLLEDVICLWLLGIHVCHVLVHVDDFIHINNLIVILLRGPACITVHIDHLIVHVDNLRGFHPFRWSSFKPAIFQGHLLNGTRR